jgi:D-glycero-D-manno-heptose 1,7-bisphosphate phosphatase
MNTPAIFLDRDGVLNVNRPDDVTSWEEFAWLPGSLEALVQLATLRYPIVVVTNQRAVARGRLTKRGLAAIHQRVQQDVERAGGYITRFYSCVCAESGRPCPCQKPSPAMLRRAQRDLDLDLSRSFMIGDKASDILCGQRAGCTSILVLTGEGCGPAGVGRLGVTEPDCIQRDLAHAARWIVQRTIGDAPHVPS